VADFDHAYAAEAMARALACAGDLDQAATWHSRATAAGATVTDDEDRKIFTDDLATGPWFGLQGGESDQVSGLLTTTLSGKLASELVDGGGQGPVDKVCGFLPALVDGVSVNEGHAVTARQREQLLR
jgi:hypothetical protein